ncbi:coiled-coil domain-containing protein 32 isoform X1 [Thamnophis elegans]|uniref:coiled-coil domain-containing protein 32 isoform X1 n=2 Tax=Thamnophis elegans TaxID=35005 RepID=UPI00137775FA|nr:coiled-coil domain-containing protein 32 isoform X1 [Thamnophis elegans]
MGENPSHCRTGAITWEDHCRRPSVSVSPDQCYFGNAPLLNCCIMIMTESVDSLVAVSSQDLWTEICSSLPHPDQNEESNNAFADSFADSYIQVMENQMEVTGPSLQVNEKPWVPLKDSELYLASLERRLMRIKGLSQEVTSKDILHTLSQAKKESWDRFLQEKSESDFYLEGTDSDESTLEYLKRWLQPEKVAVSSEEIQYLIPLGAPPEKQEAGEEEEPAPVEQ